MGKENQLITHDGNVSLTLTHQGRQIVLRCGLTKSWNIEMIILALDDLEPHIEAVDTAHQLIKI